MRYRDDPDRQKITVEGTEVCVADCAGRVGICRGGAFVGMVVVVQTPGLVGVGEGMRKGV